MKITDVKARQVLDCRCRPLVEVDVVLEDGTVGRGAAPTGSTVGLHEAFVLRDRDPREYDGLSVRTAVDKVTAVLGPAIIGMDVDDQSAIDRRMIDLDGTADKRVLGGNSIYSTSIAVARASAAVRGIPLYEKFAGGAISSIPVPCFNMINGGRYGDLTQPFSEFIVIPYRADSISHAVEMAVRLFGRLETILAKYSGRTPRVANSYGYAAPSSDPDLVLGLIQDAVDDVGYTDKFVFALDCASSEMYDQETETYLLMDERVTADELIDYMADLTSRRNLAFVEDLLDEDAWDDYPKAVARIPRTLLLGDDLIATNRERLQKAVEMKAVHGFILKPNQVGTVTEALDAYWYAMENQLVAIASGRSGGVINDAVMDFSVGLGVPIHKTGAPRSGERIEQLNFLMRAAESAPDAHLADITTTVRF